MKKLKYPLFGALIVGVALMIYFSVTKYQHKKEIAQNLQSLPAFEFKTLEGNLFTRENLQAGKKLVLIYFSPDCDYCHYEVREIKKNVSLIEKNNIQLLLVSSDTEEMVKDFIAIYDLDKVGNLTIARDEKDQMNKLFGITGLPMAYIYNTDQKLEKKYRGEVKIEAFFN